ncbi:MAG TPA: hypothetical protein PLV88_00655 [Methanoregulaceae archaeon]|jgi:hypothetical protein|nr:hypothetical protein [Burkholderiaceae bacterium]NLH25259.1 hypothetical protein [Methanomicrobiales archaeon]HNB02774.1 hypothetical protein [Methanoregulaceae archaeon]HNL87263.1 hypothetical protein [Methanoregulaceae archaeon]HNO07613.1 hypothetical protein [Methanoregulaceae archaeon]
MQTENSLARYPAHFKSTWGNNRMAGIPPGTSCHMIARDGRSETGQNAHPSRSQGVEGWGQGEGRGALPA